MLILNTAVKHKLLETISDENNIVYLYKHSPDYTFVVKTNKRKKLFSYEHTQKTDTIIVDKDVVATALPHALPADRAQRRPLPGQRAPHHRTSSDRWYY